MTAARVVRRFLHEVLVGFLAAAVVAVVGFMLFAASGCATEPHTATTENDR